MNNILLMHILGLLVWQYVLTGIGLASYIIDDEDDFIQKIIAYIIFVIFWPFFKGVNIGVE